MSYVEHSATAIVSTLRASSTAPITPPRSDGVEGPEGPERRAPESIYNWVKAPPPPVVKAPLYHSQHPGDAPVERSHSAFADASAVKATGVLGKEVRGTVRPEAFLRRRGGATAGTATLDAAATAEDGAPVTQRQRSATRKPAVPPRTAAVPAPPAEPKNFVEANAIEAMVAAPRLPPAGPPDWLRKPEYGAVPTYLARVKEEAAAAAAAAKGAAPPPPAGPRTRELGEDERGALLDGLARRRDEVMARYHKIDHKKTSSSTSTLGEIRVKERLEAQLTQLDADIAKLSVAGPILVVDGAAAGDGGGGSAGGVPAAAPPAGAYD